jgi:hypothetical protein
MSRKTRALPPNIEVFGLLISRTASELQLKRATIELNSQSGEPVHIRTDEGWSVSPEFLNRIQNRPPAPVPEVQQPSLRLGRIAPWIRTAIDIPRIGSGPRRLMRNEEANLTNAEESFFSERTDAPADRIEADRAAYRFLVRSVAQETHCAEAREALSNLLSTRGQQFFTAAPQHPDSASLAEALVNLATVVRFRSGSSEIDFPRLLREVLLEISEPSKLCQDDTPSCFVTALQYLSLISLQGATRYVQSVTELVAWGTTLTATQERIEGSEWWAASQADDERTQSLRLWSNSLYAHSLQTNPDQLRNPQQLIYRSGDRLDLVRRVWGREPVDLSTADRPASELLETIPPFVASIRYHSADTANHAVVVLETKPTTVTFFNPQGRIETCLRTDFEQSLDDIVFPSSQEAAHTPDHHGSRRTSGVTNWAGLSELERAAAICAYPTGSLKIIIHECGFPRHWLQSANPMRVALELVRRAESDSDFKSKLQRGLDCLPGTTYDRCQVDSRAVFRENAWQAAADRLDALKAPRPSLAKIEALASSFAQSPSAIGPFLKFALAGTLTPLLDFACREPIVPHALDANLETLLRWLDSAELLNATCHGHLGEVPPLNESTRTETRDNSMISPQLVRVRRFLAEIRSADEQEGKEPKRASMSTP